MYVSNFGAYKNINVTMQKLKYTFFLRLRLSESILTSFHLSTLFIVLIRRIHR